MIFPALSAMRVFKSFRAVTICSAACSVLCAAGGIVISIVTSTPVGSTIVAIDIVVFLIFSLMPPARPMWSGKITNADLAVTTEYY